jgi:hypothetical protein
LADVSLKEPINLFEGESYETTDPDMGYLALLDPGIDRRRFYSEDFGDIPDIV